jgi:hypothetical protein
MVTSGDVLHCTTKNVVSSDTSLQDYATVKILLSGNSDKDFITLRQWFEWKLHEACTKKPVSWSNEVVLPKMLCFPPSKDV